MPEPTMYIIFALCSIILLKEFVLIILLRFNFKKGGSPTLPIDRVPFVSILISVRNEEENIQACLEALTEQNYPRDRYEILVGNDHSDDNTLTILKKLEESIPNLSTYDIKELLQKKHGKMNVLAALGDHAEGEFLLFTDADTRVQPSWIQLMVVELLNGNSLITGTTLPEGNTLFHEIQGLEWIHAIGMMKVVSDAGFRSTTIGNNVALSMEAYKDVGGFRSIPFSITEDHEMYLQISKKGYKTFHLFNEVILSRSLPVANLKDLLMQRKRWMYGAFRLPLLIMSLLILNALYFPLVLVLVLFFPVIGLLLASVKIVIQSIFLKLVLNKLGVRVNVGVVFIYEFFSAFINLTSLLFYFLPTGVTWRKRKY